MIRTAVMTATIVTPLWIIAGNIAASSLLQNIAFAAAIVSAIVAIFTIEVAITRS